MVAELLPDVGQQEGKAFIAMRLIDGETLGHAAGEMSLEEKVETLLAVAEDSPEVDELGLFQLFAHQHNLGEERLAVLTLLALPLYIAVQIQ